MTDVAKKAGVSQTTVSFVLNRIEAGLPDRTKQRVLEAARELSYSPNDAARRLASNRSQTIGLAVYNISSVADYRQAASVVLASAYRAAEQKSYRIAIYTTCKRDESDQDIESYFTMPVRSHEVDGIVVWDYHVDQNKLLAGFRDGLPIVTLDRHVMEVPCVVPDYNCGYTQVVDALVRKGHKRLCLVTYVNGIYRDTKVQAAFKLAAKQVGLTTDDAIVKEIRPKPQPQGADAAAFIDDLLETPDRPTALICAYDRFALSALINLRQRGIDVPGEMAVVGCPGLPITKDPAYSLSTLDLHIDLMVSHAVDMVIRMINGEDLSGAKTLVCPQFVERSTS